MQFQRIKVGDRFWHETNDPDVKFTDGMFVIVTKLSKNSYRSIDFFHFAKTTIPHVISTQHFANDMGDHFLESINPKLWRDRLKEPIVSDC